jgi:hypothetical protein
MQCFNKKQLLYEAYPTRYYWCRFSRCIGASQGEETEFILVEHNASTGDVHGHPVTRRELKKKGLSDEEVDA